MSGQIFISYRREESRWSARILRDRLCRDFDPKQVFMDIHAIALGEDFVETIENTVAKCDALIAVIGKNWLASKDGHGNRRLDNPEDFVRMEIGAALKRKIRVIPVLVDGALMPQATDLPEDLKALVRRNALLIHDTSFEDDCQRLAAAIREILDKAAAEQRQREEAEARQREKERLEAEQREKERLEAELRQGQEAEAREREKERLEAEQRERERLAAEQQEKERLAAEQREKERLAAERRQREEKERLKAEQTEKERLEAENRQQDEQDRLAAAQRQRDESEVEQRQRESASKNKTVPGSPGHSPNFEPLQPETTPIVRGKGSTGRKPLARVTLFAVIVVILIVGLIWFASHGRREAALVTPIATPQPTPTPANAKAFANAQALANAQAYYTSGTSYFNKKDYTKAISDYSEAIKLDPNYVWAYMARGLTYREKKDYDNAISDFSAVISLSPLYGLAYYDRGLVFEAENKNTEAQADFDKAKQLGYTGP